MKQVVLRSGKAVLEDVPAPLARPDGILVKTHASCISVGTEMVGLNASASPLWQRALKRPDKVLKAARMALDKGVEHTMKVARGDMDAGVTVGYSLAGTVVAVGDEVAEFSPGDRVACAGAQFANHAEYVSIPVNLAVPLPVTVTFAEAATVALGATALQGVRRAAPTFGETFVVIGLGLIGQLAVQFLVGNGCKVIVADLSDARVEMALSKGANGTVSSDLSEEDVKALTAGVGADGVIVTASSPDSELLSRAFNICRAKARVVIVGDVGMNIQRADIYAKELDVLISTSYGPGRYNRRYEEDGLDFPISHVRWTERRNMCAYIDSLASGTVNIESLLSQRYPLEQAGEAYASLLAEERPISVILEFPNMEDAPLDRRVFHVTDVKHDGVRVGIIGPGSFIQGTHIPNLKRLPDHFTLQSVMSRSGRTANAVASQWGAHVATTDPVQVINDPEVDLILIGTRHNTHAAFALQALRAGKHVLVEKPLAISPGELREIEAFYESYHGTPPVLLTGFNRRFSPDALRVASEMRDRKTPAMVNYRMNAGYLPLDHWTKGAEGGGRNIGEACHIYDLFLFLLGSQPTEVEAVCIGSPGGRYSAADNFSVTVKFTDGSVANLMYTALGNKEYPKEHLEVFVDGSVLKIEDYLSVSAFKSGQSYQDTHEQDKGHFAMLKALAETLRSGGDWPIPLEDQIAATKISFQVEASIRS